MRYVILFTLLLSICGFNANPNNTPEPEINIYQGSTPGTSVIEIKWPDGKVERLVYKNKDVKNGAEGYMKWFDQRYDEYERRNK